jgi:hypothetical protein
MSSTRTSSIDVLPTGGDYYPASAGGICELMHDGQSVNGYVVINVIPAGVGTPDSVERMVIEACNTFPALPGAGRIADGNAAAFDPMLIAHVYPAEAPYLLRCSWLHDGEPGSGWLVDLPEGAVLVDGPTVPHGFA